MRTISLGKGRETIVDDCDAHLSAWTWHSVDMCNGQLYVQRSYRISNKANSIPLSHCVLGSPLHGKVVDHINGDALDNRRANLRIVTRRENSINSERRRQGKFKHLLGAFKPGGNKWYSVISINGKLVRLGSFDTEKEAHEAYMKAKAAIPPKIQWKQIKRRSCSREYLKKVTDQFQDEVLREAKNITKE